MATRTATAAQSAVIPKSLRVGLVGVTSTFSPGSAQSISAGDVIQMIRVPAGATVLFIGLTTTYVQATLEVGDGLTTNRYMPTQSSSAAHAAHMFVAGSVNAPYTYSTDDTIDILASLVSVTSIAGAFYLTAIYTMDSAVRS